MRALKLVLGIASVLAVAGCGLPDQYYIQSPIQVSGSGSGSGTFIFQNPDHTKDLNINFKGYELYYQFYPDTGSIPANVYDPGNSASVDAQLRSQGFLPMVSSTDIYPNRTDPVIPVSTGDIGTGFKVSVTVTPAVTPPTAAAQYTFDIILGFGNLRRNVADTLVYFGKYKDFQSNVSSPNNYYISDADCVKISVSATSVYLAVWAVSYGLIGVSTPQRSIPVNLGYLQMFINS
jgi:hypothetical protein